MAHVVDCRWDATPDGPVKVEISSAGIHLDADIARVDPSFRGHLALHNSAEDVSRILGVRPNTC